jgi:hypothetical protein
LKPDYFLPFCSPPADCPLCLSVSFDVQVEKQQEATKAVNRKKQKEIARRLKLKRQEEKVEAEVMLWQYPLPALDGASMSDLIVSAWPRRRPCASNTRSRR